MSVARVEFDAAPNPTRFKCIVGSLLQGYSEYLSKCEADGEQIENEFENENILMNCESMGMERFRTRQIQNNLQLLSKNRELYALRARHLARLAAEYENASTIGNFPSFHVKDESLSLLANENSENSSLNYRKNRNPLSCSPQLPYQRRAASGARANIENRRRRAYGSATVLDTGDTLTETYLAGISPTTVIGNSRRNTVYEIKHDYDRNTVIDKNNNDLYSNFNYDSYENPTNNSIDSNTVKRRKSSGLSLLTQRTNSTLNLLQSRRNNTIENNPQASFSRSLWNLSDDFGANSNFHPAQFPSQQSATKLVTMKAIETQTAGMLGRFHVEVKAIIGFARLAAGDFFEVSLKHGAQRWRTRGKTQADRSQIWDHTATIINCVYNAQIQIKVVELRFLKSKTLNERCFDVSRFFTAQPQLITMNLNAIGSLKLQLIITWLPLLSSKCIPQTNGMLSRSMAALPITPGTAASGSDFLQNVKHSKQIQPDGGITAGTSLFYNMGQRSKSIDSPIIRSVRCENQNGDDKKEADEYANENGIKNELKEEACQGEAANNLLPTSRRLSHFGENIDDNNNNCNKANYNDSPSFLSNNTVIEQPKICLRDKKRERRAPSSNGTMSSVELQGTTTGSAATLDKNRWRHSSTMILDSLYKDLAKSIPTIDDLAVLSSSRMNLHKSADERLNSMKRQSGHSNETKNEKASKPKSDGGNENWNPNEEAKATDRHQDPSIKSKTTASKSNSPSKTSESNTMASSSSGNGSVKKSRLSSLKKSRQNHSTITVNDYYAKIPTLGEISTNASEPSKDLPRNGIDELALRLSNRISGESKENNGLDEGSPSRPMMRIPLTKRGNCRAPSARPFSTICNAESGDARSDLLTTTRQAMTALLGEPAENFIEQRGTTNDNDALAAVNALLAQIQELHVLLARANAPPPSPSNDDKVGATIAAAATGEFAELVNFEACMLNWEAILKLNRAAILEELRFSRLGPAGNYSRGYSRRTSLYIQPHAYETNGSDNSTENGRGNNGNWSSSFHSAHHRNFSHSPSTASDETDEMGGPPAENAQQHRRGYIISNFGTVSQLQPTHQFPPSSTMEQISENDSGIDSLRQHISPYHHNDGARNPSSAASPVLKQAKDRRKSLGILLDAIHPRRRNSSSKASPEASAMRHAVGAPQTALSVSSSSVSDASTTTESRRCLASLPPAQPVRRVNATGNAEVDECLRHHFSLAIVLLKKLACVQFTPFEFTVSELLYKLEQNAVALEALRRVVMRLPAPPNVQYLFNELDVMDELCEIWLSAISTSHSVLTVPVAALSHCIRMYVHPIVTARRYLTLVDNVVESIMRFMCEEDLYAAEQQNLENPKVTLFQFVAFFANKILSIFVENVAHEAWITVNLDSRELAKVCEVMDRLRRVPVVPPLESLRHMALVLAADEPLLTAPIERYLCGASAKLAGDLAISFMCLLEHDDEPSRYGACRALSVLKRENALVHLEFLASRDESARVRVASRRAADEIRTKNNTENTVTPFDYQSPITYSVQEQIEATKI